MSKWQRFVLLGVFVFKNDRFLLFQRCIHFQKKRAEICPCRGIFQRQAPMIVIGSVCGPMRCKKGKFADGTKPLFSTFISCEIPVGSPYDFGVCELVDVLIHAPHSRVWCQTLGLCDSRFYKFCLTPQQKVDKSCSIYPF